MAYQGYSDQPANYGQSNPYGNPSPYGEAGNPYNQDTSYNAGNPYAQGQYDRRDREYEMGNMNGSGQNRILDECARVNAEARALEERQHKLEQLQNAYNKAASTQDMANMMEAIESEYAQIVEDYRGLTQRTIRLKQDRESGNPRNAPQVGKTDRQVKKSYHDLQRLDAKFRGEIRARQESEYRIVRPDATDAEVREAIADPTQPIFAQALMQSDRLGNARTTASAVRQRHAAIQKIEQDMIQLANMFQDLDALVVQQEAAVTSIEQRGEEVLDDATKGNTELTGAVDKARAARKKKWICLGIAVLIVIIIVVVVVVVVEVVKK